MRLQTKILLSFVGIWLLFLLSIYIVSHHYLLPGLLYLDNQGNHEIVINKYAYTQIINHYVALFAFLSLFVVALIGYLLRIILMNHANTLQQLHHVIAEEVKKAEALLQKISLLEKRLEKTDKIEAMFHSICDYLNSIVASLALVKDKIESMSDAESKSLLNELASINNNINQINHLIKSFQS